jgi:hypothetical protein
MELNLGKSRLWVRRITKNFNQEKELERKKKVKIEK